MLSAPIVIEPATGDIIDLAAMKLFLRIDGSALDDEIGMHVMAVVADIEQMTSTRLADQVVEIRADRFADLDHLSVGPVQDIVQLRYQDVSGVETNLAPDAYELFGAGLAMGIRPSQGNVWPSTRPVAGPIAVQLQVGYGDALPANISMAIKMAVRSRFDGTPFDLFGATVNDRLWL